MVHERLAQCGISVYVDGLVTGAQVILSIGGVEYPFMATGNYVNFEVPPSGSPCGSKGFDRRIGNIRGNVEPHRDPQSAGQPEPDSNHIIKDRVR